MSAGVAQFAATDKSENDRNDTIIVNEVVANRVDVLITEDRGVHAKAAILGIAETVGTGPTQHTLFVCRPRRAPPRL
jgi:hypothetical protein